MNEFIKSITSLRPDLTKSNVISKLNSISKTQNLINDFESLKYEYEMLVQNFNILKNQNEMLVKENTNLQNNSNLHSEELKNLRNQMLVFNEY